MEDNKTNNLSISIPDLLAILIKWLWLVIICTVSFSIIAFVYSKYYVVPLYQSQVMFLIDPINKANYSDYSDSQQLDIEYRSSVYARQLTNTYLQMLQTNSFKTRLIEEYEKKYDKRLNGSWTINVVSDTELFMIRVVSDSSTDAYEIAKMIEKVVPDTISDLMGSEKIRIADNAAESDLPINYHVKRNVLICAVAGAMLAYGIGFLDFIFDMRVKDEEDLKKRYNIPILGGVIDFDSSNRIEKKK